jgi:PncC family amidohydrolase
MAGDRRFDALVEQASAVGEALRARDETVVVVDGSTGGLLAAALIAVPGASEFMVGGVVMYTLPASRAWLQGAVEPPEGMRGATAEFAIWQAESARRKVDATWGLSETGATGPIGNRYGDPAGHSWAGVAGPVERTHHTLTGSDDRVANMFTFAATALSLLQGALT